MVRSRKGQEIQPYGAAIAMDLEDVIETTVEVRLGTEVIEEERQPRFSFSTSADCSKQGSSRSSRQADGSSAVGSR
jgi:hypothetical protein